MASTLHVNARCINYPTVDGQSIKRSHVPDDFVPWNAAFDGYSPQIYNAPRQHDEIDSNDDVISIHFNCNDGNVNRVSNVGTYSISAAGLPLNPMGRTGLAGRGRLPRWGPNHAADCLVTRWKRSDSGDIVTNSASHKSVLQFVSICRRDLQVWAIPGGKVDPGEDINATFIREFHEEALDGFDPSKEPQLWEAVTQFLSSGNVVYCGYVDDPRNTDNAWMETTVKNFHDDTGKTVANFPLKAGDDAGDLQWCDISGELKLYASHAKFIQAVAALHNAHW